MKLLEHSVFRKECAALSTTSWPRGAAGVTFLAPGDDKGHRLRAVRALDERHEIVYDALMQNLSRLLCCFALMLSTSNASSQEISEAELGLLRGLGTSMILISEFPTGRGDIDYHHGTFHFRKAIAMELASGLETEASRLGEVPLRTSLIELATDLREASVARRGDLDYWIAMLEVQKGNLSKVHRRQTSLIERHVTDRILTREREVGYLRGLSIGMRAMPNSFTERGDIDFWIRLFSLQRDAANLFARALEGDVKDLSNSFLRFTLRELAKDILALPQKGRGDIDYWSGAFRGHQKGVLNRVAEKYTAVLELIDGDTFGCSSLLDEVGEPGRMSLRDI